MSTNTRARFQKSRPSNELFHLFSEWEKNVKTISKSSLALLGVATLFASGCASIVTGHNQSLSVETHSKGTDVVGAACTLDNDKGTWFVSTPGSVVVNRSYGDMNVRCTHEKHEPGVAVVKSSVKAMAFGNIVFGGPIGGGVDVLTGAAYDYPTPIRLEMGVTQRIPGEQVPAK